MALDRGRWVDGVGGMVDVRLCPAARRWILWGAAFGLAGVALGAFGAHALAARVAPERVAAWQTGAHYLQFHGVALLALGALGERVRSVVAGWCWVAGSLLFTGSLAALVLLDQPRLGMVTPVGGVLLLAGWGAVIAAAWRGQPAR
jgi:uncharacterized membrane protein YgdD (TMEM256/DUF423 family)